MKNILYLDYFLREIVFLIVLINNIYAQVPVEGVLVNEKKQAIPYVNIGIPLAGIGTVSDDQGFFRLIIPNASLDKPIQISHIAYKTQKIPLEQFLIILKSNKGYVTLKEQTLVLREVEVARPGLSFERHIRLGRWKDSTNFSISPKDSTVRGSEFVNAIKVKEKGQFLIQSLMFTLNQNAYKDLALRINVYSIRNKKPDRFIQDSEILVSIKNQRKIVKIDLAPYEIYYDTDFFIGIEILTLVSPNKFKLALIPRGKTRYYRDISLGKWQRASGSIAMEVTLAYPK